MPAEIPGPLRNQSTDFNRAWEQLRRCLAGLRGAIEGRLDPPDPSRASRAHPFRLMPFIDGGTPKLHVMWGSVWIPEIDDDTTGNIVIPGVSPLSPQLSGGGTMTGDPSGAGSGSITLAVSTTYGVWIEVGVGSMALVDVDNFTSTEALNLAIQGYSGSTPTVVVDSTNTLATDKGTKTAGSTAKSYVWIGQVDVAASGVATVEQDLRSDVWMPLLSAAANLRSANSNNKLVTGTDGGLATFWQAGTGSSLSGSNTSASPLQVDVP